VCRHQKLYPWKSLEKPKTEMLLPRHVHVRVDLIDQDYAWVITDQRVVLSLEVQATVRLMQPTYKINDQRRDRPVAVAHVLKGEFHIVTADPKSL
jgi:hypothetical protein